MIAAIGVVAVCVVVTVVISGSVTSALGYTTGSRASVQSQASAEAGVAVARASVTLGNCSLSGGHYSSTVAPVYDAQVSYLSGASWIQGCPPGSATTMKIVASGKAQSNATVKGGSGNSTIVQSVFTAPAVTAVITASGQAVFSYGAVSADGSGTVNSVNGSTANVYVKNGSLVCNGGAGIGGSVVAANGDVTISGGCKVGGSIFAPNGTVTLSSGISGYQVNGNVVAKAVSITNSGPITGSVWSATSASINGPVAGSVVAAAGDVTMGSSSSIGGSVWATAGTFTNTYGGDTTGSIIAKNVNLAGGNAAGTTPSGGTATGKIYASVKASNQLGTWAYQTTPGYANSIGGALPAVITGWNGTTPPPPTAPSTPATPTIGEWTDWKYSSSDWPGYTVTTLSGNCTVPILTSAIAAFGTSNGLIDARGCTSGVALNTDGISQAQGTITLKSNIAIVAKKINFNNGTITSNGTQHSLWLLEEDTTADHLPTCDTSTQSFNFSGGLSINAAQGVRLMVYTPCAATVGSSNSFTGQLYDAKTTLTGGAVLTYYALGIPGYDLDTGTTTSSGSSTRNWIQQYRLSSAG